MCNKRRLKLTIIFLVIFHEITGNNEQNVVLAGKLIDVFDDLGDYPDEVVRFSNDDYCSRDDADLVKLSPRNAGDVYVMSQLLVVITAIEACMLGTPVVTNSPLGHCASKLAVQNCNCSDTLDETVFVWNTRNGRMLFAMAVSHVRSYVKTFRSTLNAFGKTKIETVFNEMLAINGLSMSKVTYKVYASFANIFARMIGIGGCNDAHALINLNGMLVYASELPTMNCFLSVNTPLGCLANIKNVLLLVQEMVQTSVILDGYSHWYAGFVFLDSLFPRKTKSDRIVGHLVGLKQLIPQVREAVRCLALSMEGQEAVTDLFVDMLFAIAVDGNIETVGLNVLYAKQNDCSRETEETEDVIALPPIVRPRIWERIEPITIPVGDIIEDILPIDGY